MPGQIVRWSPTVGFVTVTLSTTAVGGLWAVIPGTPPRPATGSDIVAPWPIAPIGEPKSAVPIRVSRMRVGSAVALKPLPVSCQFVSSLNQPLTSTTTWARP